MTSRDDGAIDGRVETVDARKQRRCLMCHVEFVSEWFGERVCRRCKTGSRWRDGAGWQSDDGVT
jgi:hypothetical protein